MTTKEEKKAKIIQLIKDAARAGDDCDCGARVKKLKFLLVIALIGSMSGHPILTVFFSIATVILSLLLLVHFRRHIGRRFAVLTIALTFGSVASGCAPLMSGENAEIIQLCQRRYETTGEACRYGISKGIRIFGIPIRHATIESAKFNAGITEVIAAEIHTGGGLVSVDQVRAYGS